MLSDIARRVRVSESAVSRWGSGSRTPTCDHLERLARVLDAPEAANLVNMSRRIEKLEEIVTGLDEEVDEATKLIPKFLGETTEIRDQLLEARRHTSLVRLTVIANTVRSEIHEALERQLSELGDDDESDIESAEDLENRVSDCMSFLQSGFERVMEEIHGSDTPEDTVAGFEEEMAGHLRARGFDIL